MPFLRVMLAAVLLVAQMASAAEEKTVARIVNGVFDSAQPSTGALLWGANPDTAYSICSGTLIGCETFLTAAHCVCGGTGLSCTGAGAPDPGDYSIFLQHAGFFGVSSIRFRSDYDFPVADIAVLKLSAPVTGIPPTAINTTATPSPGTPGLIVGFGRSGGAASDYGLKRSGSVSVTTCPVGISNSTSVCWRFQDPVGPAGEDSNTCNGDSGGPLFVDFGSGPVVAGVTSGGTSENCLPTDNSYDANVYFYRTWIEAEGGPDLENDTCGDLAQVGTPAAKVFSAVGDLSVVSPQATHTFPVSDATVALRVTMNAEDDGSGNFDLYVKAGSPPTTSDFDCRRNGRGQLALCEFPSPVGGDWYILVVRLLGSGSYQVTATAFTTACSDPANEGQPCDDGNPCTGNDTCQSESCTGSPLSDGSECNDGSLCTQGDECQAGVCTPGPGPLSGCHAPVLAGTSRFLLVDGSNDIRDRLAWRWAKGEATTLAELGDPTTNTTYTLCIYDEVGETPTLVSETVIPPGPHWTAITKGYRYVDAERANGGIRRLALKEGPDRKARIVLRGKGQNLWVPGLPLRQESDVTVQLVNESACWEAKYSTYLRRDSERFEARSD